MNKILFTALCSAVMCGCDNAATHTVSRIEGVPVDFTTLKVEGDTTTISLGGYGSSMTYNQNESLLYLLTDRGPNVDGLSGESKIFPMPDFTPAIGEFKEVDGRYKLLREIKLCDTLGMPLTGLPNEKGDGVTGEIAYNLAGDILHTSQLGIDPEGLTLAPDTTFWVSDEYGPFVANFDMNGKMLRLLSPSNGLPEKFAKRRPNRGMEGLTISGDGSTLYGIMQSPLYLPNKSTKNKSVNNRILSIDIKTLDTKEYLYTLENPKNVVSEVLWVDSSTLFVLERDGKFPKDGAGFKRIYRVDISKATDISDKEVELLSKEELSAESILAVEKTLEVDILKAIPSYTHDKIEGMTFIDGVLSIVNDDDFGVIDRGNGGLDLKIDRNGDVDRSEVYRLNR